MEKVIVVKDWRGEDIEMNKEMYVRRFLESVDNALAPLRWDHNEECNDIANRVAEMAGEKFEMIWKFENKGAA